MARRRMNGEGTVRKRPDGRWEARLTWRDPDTDKLVARSFYGKTRAVVVERLKKARERLEEGAPVRDASRTVGEWLAQWRTTTLAASDRKPSTRESYALLCRKHLESAPFGSQRLDKLRPSDVEALILRLTEKTKPGKGRGADPVRAYSDSTIRSIYTILRAGLDGAVRDGMLARNPAAAVKRPGVARQEARYLSSAEVEALLAAAEGARYAPVLTLIASTGMRRGEALGLRWDDVDLDRAVLRVVGTLARVDGRLVVSDTKTARSRRELPLATPLVALLRRQKAQQAAERLRAANKWIDSGLVFTTELGGPVDPRNLLRLVETAAAKASLEGVGVHTLRHSAAVALLDGGAHIKLVADVLGHSSIAITGDVYGHTAPEAARSALAALAGFGG